MFGFKKDNPANMYLFKVDNKNIKKGVKYVQNHQISHLKLHKN